MSLQPRSTHPRTTADREQVPFLGGSTRQARNLSRTDVNRGRTPDLLAKRWLRPPRCVARDRLPRLRLIGMNPRLMPRQIDLRPLQTGHVRPPQARCEGRRCRVRQVLRQLGQEPPDLTQNGSRRSPTVSRVLPAGKSILSRLLVECLDVSPEIARMPRLEVTQKPGFDGQMTKSLQDQYVCQDGHALWRCTLSPLPELTPDARGS